MDPITLGTECDLHERPVESIRRPSPTRAVQAPILLPRRVPSIDQPGRPLAEATREPHRHRLGASEVAPPGLGVRVLRNDHQAAAVPRVLHREDILPPAKSPGVPQLDGGAAQQAVPWRPQQSQHNGVSLRPLHTPPPASNPAARRSRPRAAVSGAWPQSTGWPEVTARAVRSGQPGRATGCPLLPLCTRVPRRSPGASGPDGHARDLGAVEIEAEVTGAVEAVAARGLRRAQRRGPLP